MLPIDYLPGARRDFDESFDWFAARSPVVALWFVGAAERALTDIAGDPERFAPVDEVHRQCPVTRFPFRVVYRVAKQRALDRRAGSRKPNPWEDNAAAGRVRPPAVPPLLQMLPPAAGSGTAAPWARGLAAHTTFVGGLASFGLGGWICEMAPLPGVNRAS